MLRLDRMLVTLGRGSRSEMQKAIRGGRVRVNGNVQRDPSAQVGEDAEILLNGEKLDTRLTRLVMLHKPAGLLTAARDKKQPTVMDLLPPEYAAIGCMPVGRLDKDTEGLLLLTDDGELAHRLLSPKYHVDKRYFARVDGPLDQADVDAFAAGMTLGDGLMCLPAGLEPLAEGTCIVTLREGKFHQVKRMLAARGAPVLYLKRLSMGPLTLDAELPIGGWRELTAEETASLRCTAGL